MTDEEMLELNESVVAAVDDLLVEHVVGCCDPDAVTEKLTALSGMLTSAGFCLAKTLWGEERAAMLIAEHYGSRVKEKGRC